MNKKLDFTRVFCKVFESGRKQSKTEKEDFK